MSIALNIGFYVFGIKEIYTPLHRRNTSPTEQTDRQAHPSAHQPPLPRCCGLLHNRHYYSIPQPASRSNQDGKHAHTKRKSCCNRPVRTY
jgi:hypothetical protein